MEKNCMNCKWFRNGKCYNKEVKASIEMKNNTDGITYVEQGYLSENIYDNLNVSEVAELIIGKLYEQDFIKKTKNINKFDCEDIEVELAEIIDNALSGGIMNYFNPNNSSNDLLINEPRDFSCRFWE